MALPAIMRRLFAGDGYGPLLKDDIVSRRISIQDWSSAFDYQPATAVRGSNGKPYWSVAASGPNSGGAANPVNDDGSHWVSLPSMADIAAMNYATQSWVAGQNYATQNWVGSQNYATQGWVGNQGYATQAWVWDRNFATRDWVGFIGTTPVYVNSGVQSSGDGFTPENAKKTIGEAIELCRSLNHVLSRIYIAGGTYNEPTVYVYNIIATLYLQGDVTIDGRFVVNGGGYAEFSGDNHNLTVTGGIDIVESSFGAFYNLNLLTVSAYNRAAFRVLNNSSCFCNSSFDFTATDASTVLQVDSSYCSFSGSDKNGWIKGSASYSAISCANCGFLSVVCTLYIAAYTANAISIELCSSFESWGKVYTTEGRISANGIYISHSSSCALHNGCDIHAGTSITGACCITCGYSSSIILASETPSVTYILRADSSVCSAFGCFGGSAIDIYGTLNISAPNNGHIVFSLDDCGYILFASNYTHTINNTWDAVMGCTRNSALYIDKNVAFSGTPHGRKFSVSTGGQISTGGRIAAENMPGDGDYVIGTNSFGYFS